MSKIELQERQDKKRQEMILNLGLPSILRVNEKERGMALPFQPLIMCFSNINYYVVVPVELKKQAILEDRLQILVNVTGAFRPGILTTLVGVSGAGKTTLMDVLAGRKMGGKRGALLFLVILKTKQRLPESLVIMSKLMSILPVSLFMNHLFTLHGSGYHHMSTWRLNE
ncbi:hypothetical protein Taro_006240 [Colocasia esculenta]|uniref:ABC transporter domain-containing protein n=1 Tax=Colocasia esculenta TaxID=4460 RepID=A0A843TS46_COLES|nr:hypothetical protein [Colocasia esculenta]